MNDLNSQLSQLSHKVDSLCVVANKFDRQELFLTRLNGKVDALYAIIEQLSSQIRELLALSLPEAAAPLPALPEVEAMEERVAGDRLVLEDGGDIFTTLQHKDILIDSESREIRQGYNNDEQNLSPELQVRRLTAQVTAAYNRIAALEEQLLSLRSTAHS